MAYEIPSAVAIDSKLRQEFRDRIRERDESFDASDPVVRVLFRTFATQLQDLYSETDRIRLGLLDELIEGLGVGRRRPRAAQTIVRFSPTSGSSAWIEAGTELTGEAETGERLTFTTDAPVAVSDAHIAAAFAYQDGELRLISGVDLPDETASLRPSTDPVRVSLGPYPAVYLAVENLPEQHLSGHGFFFDLSPEAERVQRALRHETWSIVSDEGVLTARGVLRPRRGNGGVSRLRWLSGGETEARDDAAAAENPDLPDGYYAGRTVLLPSIPEDRRGQCTAPRAMAGALKKLFPAGPAFLEKPRAWLRISMPMEVPALHEAVSNVSMHAVSASNAECFNETIRFAEHGTSIPVSREAGAARLLVAPLSVFGESEKSYLPQFAPSDEPGRGRYSIHNGRIRLDPAQRPDGTREEYANLRMWLTAGSAGNRVGPGKIQSFLKRGSAPSVRVMNPASAAGGSDAESFDSAQRRFAGALLSRDRIVSEADMSALARSFDPRIGQVETSLALERGPSGALDRVQHVRCTVDPDAFVDPAEEMRVLREELERFLEQRMLYGTHMSLELVGP